MLPFLTRRQADRITLIFGLGNSSPPGGRPVFCRHSWILSQNDPVFIVGHGCKSARRNAILVTARHFRQCLLLSTPAISLTPGLSTAFCQRHARNGRSRKSVPPLRLRADDPAVAMRTDRCQRVDRALGAIEGVMLPANDDFKRLVIFVLTNFACSHSQY
jgi:hypothetical protein